VQPAEWAVNRQATTVQLAAVWLHTLGQAEAEFLGDAKRLTPMVRRWGEYWLAVTSAPSSLAESIRACEEGVRALAGRRGEDYGPSTGWGSWSVPGPSGLLACVIVPVPTGGAALSSSEREAASSGRAPAGSQAEPTEGLSKEERKRLKKLEKQFQRPTKKEKRRARSEEVDNWLADTYVLEKGAERVGPGETFKDHEAYLDAKRAARITVWKWSDHEMAAQGVVGYWDQDGLKEMSQRCTDRLAAWARDNGVQLGVPNVFTFGNDRTVAPMTAIVAVVAEVLSKDG